jgi:hypothetical protein
MQLSTGCDCVLKYEFESPCSYNMKYYAKTLPAQIAGAILKKAKITTAIFDSQAPPSWFANTEDSEMPDGPAGETCCW